MFCLIDSPTKEDKTILVLADKNPDWFGECSHFILHIAASAGSLIPSDKSGANSSDGLVGRAGAKRSRGPGFETALVTLKCQKPGFESLLEAPYLCSIARPAF